MTAKRQSRSVFIAGAGIAVLAMAFLFLKQTGEAPAVAAENAPALTTVTDLLGRKVEVRVPVRRVILGEGRQLYLVAALDPDNPIRRVVGWRKDLIQSGNETARAVGAPASACGSREVRRAVPYVGE